LRNWEDLMVALLSIKPEFVEKIFSGNKWFEYRKVIFKKNVKKIVVYSTMPVGMIVGKFSIEDIIEASPKEIWDLTKKYSGVNKAFYNKYFEGRSKGFAIKIGKTTRYEALLDPRTLFNSFVAPQSFCYLSKKSSKMINKYQLARSADSTNSTINSSKELGIKIVNDTFQYSNLLKAI